MASCASQIESSGSKTGAGRFARWTSNDETRASRRFSIRHGGRILKDVRPDFWLAIHSPQWWSKTALLALSSRRFAGINSSPRPVPSRNLRQSCA